MDEPEGPPVTPPEDGNVVPMKRRKGVDWSPDKKPIKYSTSSGSMGRVVNGTVTWGELCERMGKTAFDNVTMEEYLAKPVAWQDKRKNNGYFVGGQFTKGARKLRALTERTLLTFDIDNCSPTLLVELRLGLGWLAQHEYFLYTTRKHTPQNPRVRVVVPLKEAIPVAQYAPAARIIAEKIDPAMGAIDPVSFRASQIMYWPSTNYQAEFISKRNKGLILDARKTVVEWGDWTDYAKLPRSKRERDLRESGDKATDPTTKRGIVGAFCRAYNIHAAIEEFLPDIYTPGEGGEDGNERYSYAAGSTTNGAVVYEGGNFLYSWHGTDPCADKLVNAFDLVRIHKFGDRDPNPEMSETLVDYDENPARAPSYVAFAESLVADEAVVSELRADNYDSDAILDDFAAEEPDEPTMPPPARWSEPDPEAVAPPEPAWQEGLEVNPKGIIKASLHNITLILENDLRFKDALAYNTFLEEPVLVKRIRSKQYGYDTKPVKNKESGDLLGHGIEIVIRCILESPRGQGKTGYSLRVPDRDMKDAVTSVSMANPFHPVARYLDGCVWDGVPRIRKLWHSYFHAADTPYHQAVAFNWMVAAVARIFEPGHKFDFVPILEGPQGIRKSTGLRVLAGNSRFGELTAHFDDTAKLVENMQGKWIMEIPELAQFRKAEADVMKTFFSVTSDRIRLAWGRGAKDYLRQSVFAGTTNNKEYLKDPTGARRYWPVALGGQVIDTEGLAEDRDALWGEAVQCYRHLRRLHEGTGDLPLFLDEKVTIVAQGIQAQRMVTDPDDILRGQIEAWLDTPVPAGTEAAGYRTDPLNPDDLPGGDELAVRTITCVKDIAFHVLGHDDRTGDMKTAHAIGRAMAQMPSWEKRRKVCRLSGRLGVQQVYDRLPDPGG